MPHKFKGVRRFRLIKNKCYLCWKVFSKEENPEWWQGDPYHKDCFQNELKKPLHKRFANKTM